MEKINYKGDKMNNELLKIIKPNTLITNVRLNKIEEFVNMTKTLEGDIAEVGVYKGGSGYLISETAKEKNIYLFDTFTGLPQEDKSKDNGHKKGDFGNISKSDVYKLFESQKNVKIFEGIFPKDTSHNITNNKFCFVHIDVDIYQSVKDCLEFFYLRMVKGGIMMLDDYNHPSCKGAKIATDEFCKDNNCIVESTVECQVIIRC